MYALAIIDVCMYVCMHACIYIYMCIYINIILILFYSYFCIPRTNVHTGDTMI